MGDLTVSTGRTADLPGTNVSFLFLHLINPVDDKMQYICHKILSAEQSGTKRLA
jgi:hypothetical protein